MTAAQLGRRFLMRMPLTLFYDAIGILRDYIFLIAPVVRVFN